jgi:membrane protease YdiL (CAAX protease family)
VSSWRKVFSAINPLAHWRAIDEEWMDKGGAPPEPGPPGRKKRRHQPPSPAGGRYDFRPLVVLVVVSISLTLQEYYGDRNVFIRLFPELAQGDYGQLRGFVWWSGWRFFGYVVLPILAIWAMRGERVRDYFVSLRGFFRHLPIYVGLFLIVLPTVIIAARYESFYTTYPFYKWSNRSAFDLWAWQALYALQFVSLEFFFRGFMLKALAPRLGSAAIFVMVVPYCMIHFGKPMMETIGAIIAGVALGTLALRTRSIWGGVLIHCAVALTMDLLALSECPPADSGRPCPGR